MDSNVSRRQTAAKQSLKVAEEAATVLDKKAFLVLGYTIRVHIARCTSNRIRTG